jgi:hypothetical protein
MSSRITRRRLFGMATTAAVAAPAARVFAFAARRPLQTTVLEARVRFVPQTFVRPLIISSGKITEITEAQAEVRVRVDGREAVGRGSIYLSDLWAWPDPAFTHAQRDAVLRKLCLDIAQKLAAMCGGEAAHPLELGLRLHESVCREKSPPVLARAVCLSPFDAAIHDAVGIALGRSAFDFYREPVPLPTADPHFAGRGDRPRDPAAPTGAAGVVPGRQARRHGEGRRPLDSRSRLPVFQDQDFRAR